jgi:deoxyadenosine/deoxycytidine kinase
MTSKKQPLIISFEGNIGSGKSSIFRYIQHNCELIFSKELKICFIDEPKNIIASIIDYYNLSFQLNAYIMRIYKLKYAIDKNYDIIFTERSLLSDKKIFGKMLREEFDYVDENEYYKIYNKLYSQYAPYIDNMKFIYIRTKPHACLHRINKRGRKTEYITLYYIQNYHHYYDTWLNTADMVEKKNVIIVDGNHETNKSLFVENNFYDQLIDKIVEYVSNKLSNIHRNCYTSEF